MILKKKKPQCLIDKSTNTEFILLINEHMLLDQLITGLNILGKQGVGHGDPRDTHSTLKEFHYTKSSRVALHRKNEDLKAIRTLSLLHWLFNRLSQLTQEAPASESGRQGHE